MTNTPKNKTHLEDEIDLFKIFQILFHEKWKIVLSTIMSIIIGSFYYFSQTNNFRVSLDISSGSNEVFFKYIKLNEILSSITSALGGELKEEKTIYIINPQKILNKFAIKYSNRVGVINVISQKPFIETFSDSENFRNQIIANAKNFTLSKQDNSTYKLDFYWPNKEQITNLANLTINQTLNIVKEEVIKDLRSINESIKDKYYDSAFKSDKNLQTLLAHENDKIKSRLLFLNEQYEIAKKLDIQFNKKFIPETSSTSFNSEEYSLSLTSQSPYYLIGYEAIYQEIKNLERRTDQEKLLMSDNYLTLIKDKRDIDSFSKQLEKFISTLGKEDTKDWINYNLSFIDIYSLKKSKLFILSLSCLLGLSFGIIYALSYSYYMRKKFNKS